VPPMHATSSGGCTRHSTAASRRRRRCRERRCVVVVAGQVTSPMSVIESTSRTHGAACLAIDSRATFVCSSQHIHRMDRTTITTSTACATSR
jgi:hypothetical protein